MIRCLLACCYLLCFTALSAQSDQYALLDGANVLSFTPADVPFRAVSLRYGERGLNAATFPYLQYRYRTAAGTRTEWLRWARDAHASPEADYLHSGLLLLPADLTELEVYVAVLDYAPADAALLRVYTPRAGDAHRPVSRSGDCAQPAFLTRAEWCPAGDCAEHPGPSPTDPTHLIVHHSATANTATDYDAVVRAIWDFHVNTNGWSDIGYNWLIAPDGTIYAGRGDDVIGAHFCGQNTATTGICILGNYVATPPAAASLAALESLAAWKLDELGLAADAMSVHAPSGLNLEHVSGHRDGCATTCPGDSLYVRLPDVRAAVAAQIAADCGNALAGPSNLSADLEGDAGVRLSWQDNSPNETGFELERAPTVNGPFTLLQTVAADSTAYLDTDVVSNTPYFYRLRAVNATDTTDYSNQTFILTGFVSTSTLATEVFTLSPNPARDFLHLSFADSRERRVILLDALGRPVLRHKTRNISSRIALPALPAGVYYVRVQTAATQGTQRIVRY